IKPRDRRATQRRRKALSPMPYSVIDTTTPAPTVLPPSRMAKRCFSSIAIGVISSTSMVALSPGMIISVPADNLTALNCVLVDPAQQTSHIVPRNPLVQKLAEHLNPRHHGLLRVAQPHDLNFLPHPDLAALDATRHHRAATRDREHVLDRHQKRLV